MIIQLVTGNIELNSTQIKTLKEVYHYNITASSHRNLALLGLEKKDLVCKDRDFFECTSKGDAAMKIINRLERNYIGEEV